MKDNIFLAWVLLISTFLIAGKAIGVLNIGWLFAFAPLLLMIASIIVIVIAAIIFMKVQDKKDGDELI